MAILLVVLAGRRHQLPLGLANALGQIVKLVLRVSDDVGAPARLLVWIELSELLLVFLGELLGIFTVDFSLALNDLIRA